MSKMEFLDPLEAEKLKKTKVETVLWDTLYKYFLVQINVWNKYIVTLLLITFFYHLVQLFTSYP